MRLGPSIATLADGTGRGSTGRRLRGLLAPALAALIALGLLVGLGVWQLNRLHWKEQLLATIAARTTQVPQPLPTEDTWQALRAEDYGYRHVTVSGRFLHDQEVRVFRPLSAEDAKGQRSGIGDLILTPLQLASGAVVIVNRGFVPQDRADPATRPEGQIAGPVTVTGLMREPEARNAFTPADDPARGTWFTRDPAEIGRVRHLDRVAPFTIDADASAVPGGLPQGGETVLAIPNNHLSYALTWFGLAIGLAGVFSTFAWRRLKGAAELSSPRPLAEKEGSQHKAATP